MALKRFTNQSLDTASVQLLPTKNPIITYIEYPGGLTYASSAGGQTVIVHGYNFRPGITVYLDTTPYTTTRIDGTRVSFVTPAIYQVSTSTDLYVINSDGTGAMLPQRFQVVSQGPTWITPAGSIGRVDEFIYTFTVAATGDSTIRYSLVSGTLPVGYTLTPETGVITGSHNIPVQNTIVYSFTLRVTDREGQYADRTFSITFVPTYPTWLTDTALGAGRVGQYYTTRVIAISNDVLIYGLATGSSLPAGLSLNTLSGVISGTPTSATNTTFVINAIDNENNTTPKTFSLVIT